MVMQRNKRERGLRDLPQVTKSKKELLSATVLHIKPNRTLPADPPSKLLELLDSSQGPFSGSCSIFLGTMPNGFWMILLHP